MELDKISERDMPLFGRKDLLLKASFPGSATPKKEMLIKDIAKLAKASEELVVVDKVEQKFGGEAMVSAFVYRDADSMKKFRKRKGKKEKKKKKAKKEKK